MRRFWRLEVEMGRRARGRGFVDGGVSGADLVRKRVKC